MKKRFLTVKETSQEFLLARYPVLPSTDWLQAETFQPSKLEKNFLSTPKG